MLSRAASLLVVFALIAAACGSEAGVAETTTPLSNPTATVAPAEPGLAIVPEGGAGLSETRGGPIDFVAHEGLVLPILEDSRPWFRVLTTCGREVWVGQAKVDTVPRSSPALPGPGFDLAGAVVVVDAGHGGRDLGAPGASGTWESHVNLEIATLLRDRLSQANSVDWETGMVTPGDDYPAVARVWMTRDPDGPLEGDIELGLAYRAEMANRVGADAMLAIHNNSVPGETKPTPGTDVFYSVAAEGSDRLASLVHEELVRGLEPLGAEFGDDGLAGPRTRVEPDGTDFYGMLRRAEVPTVIIEGLYISEPAEEQILMTDLGKQAYADGVYRGLIRFLTTDESGTAINEPESFSGNVGTVTNQACVVPTQP